MIKRLAIIGVGLIGGSLALALKSRGCVEHVVGYSRNEENLKKGIDLNIIDSYSTSLEETVKGCDVILLAVPLGAMSSMLAQIKPYLEPNTIVTDVGSAKSSVVSAAKQYLVENYANFVAAHPIAGTENSGVESGFSELFQNRKVIVTPDDNTSKEAIEVVKNMWEDCGALVETMTVKHHDEIFAATSHLPHMLAYSLVNCLADMEDKVEIFNYAAGGFRDISRIASSDPTMWRDICLHNKDALSSMLKQYSEELSELSKKINTSQSDELYEYFSRAKKRRDDLIGQC